MGKTKVKKQDTFIDMTAMSDVTVLLLTFFMLTATFLPNEPVQVQTPASVSEVKVPDYNSLTLLIDTEGRVFMNLDRDEDKRQVLAKVASEYGLPEFSKQETFNFVEQTHIGVPLSRMRSFLADKNEKGMPRAASDRVEEMKKLGIPTDSANNQLASWVKAAKAVNPDLQISIKADRLTPYPYVDRVMKILVDIEENRYNLVTVLRAMPENF